MDEIVPKQTIDTTNKFFVGAHGDTIMSLILQREFTREEALNLAAYLVAIAETQAGPSFSEVLRAIEHT